MLLLPMTTVGWSLRLLTVPQKPLKVAVLCATTMKPSNRGQNILRAGVLAGKPQQWELL